jgi:hypothetical protein
MQFSIDSLLDAMAGIAYLTDVNGKIMNLGRQNWNAFASANNGEDLLNGESVLGRPVFDCVSGDEVRGCYQRCFDAILGERLEFIRVMSRCDSPTARRQLWITMRPVQGRRRVSGLLVQVVVVSEEMRPPVDLFDFPALGVAATRQPMLPLLSMCSYCQNVRFPPGSDEEEGEWMTAEDYYRRGGHSAVRISHGLCPDCYTLTEAMLPH